MSARGAELSTKATVRSTSAVVGCSNALHLFDFLSGLEIIPFAECGSEEGLLTNTTKIQQEPAPLACVSPVSAATSDTVPTRHDPTDETNNKDLKH